MAVSDKTRLRWFDLGAEAYQQQRRDDADAYTEPTYVCPLCVQPFRKDAVRTRLLSAEHVPPAWYGGTELVLTCRKCNNTDGSKLDADAELRERLDQFTAGRLDGVIKKARVTIAGVTANAQIEAVSGVFTVKAPHKINSPAVRTGISEAKKGESGTLQYPGLSELGANISCLRSAYLVLFAAFGYSIALDPAMDLVRRQIRDVESGGVIRTCLVIGPVSAQSTLRIFARMTKPDDLACWLVQFGRYRVVLPLAGDTTFYERLAKASEGGKEVSQTGEVCDWPTEPTFGLT